MSIEMEAITRSNIESSMELSEHRSDVPEEETTQHVVKEESSPRVIEIQEHDEGLDSGKCSIMAMGILL